MSSLAECGPLWLAALLRLPDVSKCREAAVARGLMQQPGELPVLESEDDDLLEGERLKPVTVDDRRMQKGVHDPRKETQE